MLAVEAEVKAGGLFVPGSASASALSRHCYHHRRQGCTGGGPRGSMRMGGRRGGWAVNEKKVEGWKGEASGEVSPGAVPDQAL